MAMLHPVAKLRIEVHVDTMRVLGNASPSWKMKKGGQERWGMAVLPGISLFLWQHLPALVPGNVT